MKKLNYLVATIGIAGLLFTVAPQAIHSRFEEPKVYAKSQETVKHSETLQQLEDLVVQKGDTFSVTLSANPSSGYGWESNFDTEYLQLIRQEFVPYNTPADLNYDIPISINPCVPEKEAFKFHALKSGRTEVTFSYRRPWIKDKPPLDEKTFLIGIN